MFITKNTKKLRKIYNMVDDRLDTANCRTEYWKELSEAKLCDKDRIECEKNFEFWSGQCVAYSKMKDEIEKIIYEVRT